MGFDSTYNSRRYLQANCKSDTEFILNYNQLYRANNFYFRINGNSITTTIEEKSNYVKTVIKSSVK